MVPRRNGLGSDDDATRPYNMYSRSSTVISILRVALYQSLLFAQGRLTGSREGHRGATRLQFSYVSCCEATASSLSLACSFVRGLPTSRAYTYDGPPLQGAPGPFWTIGGAKGV